MLTVLPTPDGKVLVGGSFEIGQTPRESICRLNNDGSLDATFTPPANWGASLVKRQIRSILLQPDGNILLGGNFTIRDGAPRDSVARLTPSGSLDAFTTSQFEIFSMALLPNGKILLGGQGVRRLETNGTVDTNFKSAVQGYVFAMAVQRDGKILVAPNSVIQPTVTRLNPDGAFDTNFVTVSLDGGIGFIKIQDDDKIIIGGSFTNIVGKFVGGIARLQTNGVLDTSFASTSRLGSGFIGAKSAQLAADGSVTAVGLFRGDTPDHRFIARFLGDGSLDSNFKSSHGLGGPGVWASGLLLQQETKFTAVVTNAAGARLARFFLDGTPDPEFSSPVFKGSLPRVSLYTNSSIIALHTFIDTNSATRYELLHLAEDGQLLSQATIKSDGVVSTLSPQSDGTIVIGGKFQNIAGVARDRVARMSLDGTLDPLFNVTVLGKDPIDPVNVVAALPDGKVLIGIGVSCTCYTTKFLVRVNSDGSVDNSFNIGSRGYVRGLVVQPDGKILAFGNSFQDDFKSSPGVARYNADGSFDQQFNSPYGYLVNGVVDIVLDKDGKIVVLEATRVSRLNSDGSLDTTFPTTGFGPGPISPGTQFGFDLLGQPDGNVLVAGVFGSIQLQSRSTIARLFGTPVPIPIHAANIQNGLSLDWSNAALSLQTAPEPAGPYITVPDAKSPWTIPNNSGAAFFRLVSE